MCINVDVTGKYKIIYLGESLKQAWVNVSIMEKL